LDCTLSILALLLFWLTLNLETEENNLYCGLKPSVEELYLNLEAKGGFFFFMTFFPL